MMLLHGHRSHACNSAAQLPQAVLHRYCSCQLQATRPVSALHTLAAGADENDPLAEGDLVCKLAAGGTNGRKAVPATAAAMRC